MILKSHSYSEVVCFGFTDGQSESWTIETKKCVLNSYYTSFSWHWNSSVGTGFSRPRQKSWFPEGTTSRRICSENWSGNI